MTTMAADWLNEVHGAVGSYVYLETVDGIRREGRLSGLRLKSVIFNGEERGVIHELELNGDPTDCVEFYRVASMEVEQVPPAS